MDISITHVREDDGPKSGPITVGWFLTQDKGAVMYDAPERLIFRQTNKAHAKSASRCPAVVQMESRYFIVKCPFDMHIGFSRDDKGKAQLVNRAGVASPIRGSKLGEVMTLVSEVEWRYPDRPTVQMVLPYCFIADEVVYMTQVGTFAHYRRDPLPGTIFGGRFPINVWPRPLMWAFEWHDITKPLKIARGDPLFYVTFETLPQDRSVAMVEAEVTPDLKDYMEMIGGAVNYVNQTFSLFEAAEARRPAKLLTPMKRRTAEE